ncbi:PAS domain-containing sensor histidine kinase [Rhodoplanes roseus]|nr:PAS domain-containing protein [Rhodoplanes roseus]
MDERVQLDALQLEILRVTVDTIPIQVWRMQADGRVTFLNRRWLDYTGLAREEVLGLAWRSAIHPDDLPPLLAEWRRLRATGEGGEFEARLRRHDGVYRWFLMRAEPLLDASGTVVGWCGANTDIEARRCAEHALRLIVDTIPVMAWQADADGAMEFQNQRWRDYTGLALEQAVGWRWAEGDLVHPDDLPGLLTSWRAILTAQSPGEAEARLRRRDGEYRWLLFRAEPLRNEAGTIIKWFGTNLDIEDRRRAEDSLRQAQAQLAQVTRVTTLGEMTASIAHEVNQPLSAIQTNAEAGLRWLARPEQALAETRRVLHSIIGNADRASTVIQRIRDLTRKTTPEMRPIAIGTAVEEVLLLVAHEASVHKTVIRTDLAHDLPVVRGDRVQLQQVLINLLVNAMEAMAGLCGRPRDILIRTRPYEDGIVVEVEDSGPGIDGAEIERLFDPFVTTKPDGMGMGLSISRSIVAAHGGRIWAKANEGPGVTFRFTLPVRDPKTESDVPAD